MITDSRKKTKTKKKKKKHKKNKQKTTKNKKTWQTVPSKNLGKPVHPCCLIIIFARYTSYTTQFTCHYENTPIQIYRKCHLQKLKNFI